MAYAFSVTRVSITGLAFAGAEVWSTGFFVGYDDAGASNPTQTAVDAIAARWTTFFTNTNTHVANDYTTTQVKMAQLNTDGSTMLDNVLYHNYVTPPTGLDGGAPMPAQVTLAATLMSNNVRGLASKGRMYLPGINHPIGSDGAISSTNIGLLATNLETFIEGVNTDLGVAGRVILASFGRTTPTVAPGVNAEVTNIKIGGIYDTQRRRRNGLNEVYQTRAIAA